MQGTGKADGQEVFSNGTEPAAQAGTREKLENKNELCLTYWSYAVFTNLPHGVRSCPTAEYPPAADVLGVRGQGHDAHRQRPFGGRDQVGGSQRLENGRRLRDFDCNP